jgi:hypothetical protein
VLRQLAKQDHLDRLLGKIGHALAQDSAVLAFSAPA